MTLKLQQFWIYKFSSERLKAKDNRLTVDLNTARKNGEVVSIGYNQVLKTIFRITGKTFSQEYLDSKIKEKKKLSKFADNIDCRKKITEINREIENILFVPEIISIQFENKTHYQNILDKGLWINGKSYVRLLAGAGNIRRNTVIFCDESIKSELVKILNNGRNEQIKLVPAKFNAYFSLLNSSMLPVSFPKFTVVKDCLMKTSRPMDFISDDENGNDVIEAGKMVEIEANSFDGQGLISPALSEKWAGELGVDYLPSSFIIRAPFIKGMVATFDFQAFADLHGKTEITDVYGNVVLIKDVELILSESQFKLWSSYSSLQSYIENCSKNDLGFGVSRIAPKESKSYVHSNYQFLQVLKLSDQQIEALCQPTIDYFSDLFGGDPDKMLLYSLGDTAIEGDWYSRLEPITKALVINRDVANDEYVRKHFINSLNKKVKESYLGTLLFEGNYATLISDPYAQAQHIFDLPVTGLLADGQHYSYFWNERGVKEVAACRAPLTFQTEIVKLHLQSGEVFDEWYKYIQVGVIVPAFGIGIDVVRWAD